LPDWLFVILAGDRAAFAPDFAGDISFAAGGILTTGLFLPIAIVLWAVIALFLVLAILEDTGYLARLAVLVDTVLHKIGLHGFAIVPTLVSLGCNVPGVTAARSLETRKQRFMMIALLGVFVPCGAQIGMMEELVPGMIGWVFLTLAIGYLGFGWILNKVWPGESPEILMFWKPAGKTQCGKSNPMKPPALANGAHGILKRERGQRTGFHSCLKGGWKMVAVNHLLVAHKNRPFNYILKFPYISLP